MSVKERERVCVCERERVCVCMCVYVRERWEAHENNADDGHGGRNHSPEVGRCLKVAIPAHTRLCAILFR